MNLQPRDLEVFARLLIPEELLERAKIVRVTSAEAQIQYGINIGDDAGIVFPYYSLPKGQLSRRLTARIRRDNPPRDSDGKIQRKYVSPYPPDPRHLYFAPCQPVWIDTEVPEPASVVLVEAEKSALALLAWCERHDRRFIPVGLGGCWNWRGRIGKSVNEDGERIDEKGPLPDLQIASGRRVYIIYDSNCLTNGSVYAAREKLIEELLKLKSDVRVIDLPASPGVNGPDDFIALKGDMALFNLFESAVRRANGIKRSAETKFGAVTRCFDTITPKPIAWVWQNRIPLAKLTLLIGDPGLGKSLVTIAIASHVSCGKEFPDGAPCARGSVLLLSAEDDPEDTIRPRLDAAGADVSRVHILESVRVALADGAAGERGFSLEADLDSLEGVLTRLSDVRLVVVDPISAYLGGTDSHVNSEVRTLLAPLAALAARCNVAVLVVSHLRKSAGPAVHRAIGSIAFAAAARAVFAVAPAPSDNNRRVMLPVKQNLSAPAGGLAFQIEVPTGVPRLSWLGAVELDAEEVLGGFESGEDRTERRQAKEWLADVLGAGAIPAKEIRSQANNAGWSWRTVERAKTSLGIRAEKNGFNDGWKWALPRTPPYEDRQPHISNLAAFEQPIDKTEDKGTYITEVRQENKLAVFGDEPVTKEADSVGPPPAPVPCVVCGEVQQSALELARHLEARHSTQTKEIKS